MIPGLRSSVLVETEHDWSLLPVLFSCSKRGSKQHGPRVLKTLNTFSWGELKERRNAFPPDRLIQIQVPLKIYSYMLPIKTNSYRMNIYTFIIQYPRYTVDKTES